MKDISVQKDVRFALFSALLMNDVVFDIMSEPVRFLSITTSFSSWLQIWLFPCCERVSLWISTAEFLAPSSKNMMVIQRQWGPLLLRLDRILPFVMPHYFHFLAIDMSLWTSLLPLVVDNRWANNRIRSTRFVLISSLTGSFETSAILSCILRFSLTHLLFCSNFWVYFIFTTSHLLNCSWKYFSSGP